MGKILRREVVQPNHPTTAGAGRAVIASFIHLVIAIGLFFMAAAPAALAQGANEGEELPVFAVDGFISASQVNRQATTQWPEPNTQMEDKDLLGQTRLDITMPRSNRYEFHLFGSMRKDTDGDQDITGYYPMEGPADTQTSDTRYYLFDAHVAFNKPLAIITQARLGRHANNRDTQVILDGIAVDLSFSKQLDLTLYGGNSVHYFEADQAKQSDPVSGAGLDFKPARYMKLSLDYLSLQDRRDPDEDIADQLTAIKWWQRFSLNWLGVARMTQINGEQRNLKLRALGSMLDHMMVLRATYFRQYRTENELSNELSSFEQLLGASQPYQTTDLLLRWLFATHFALDLGTYKRSMLEEVTASPFNREYQRDFAVFQVLNLPMEGLSVSLTTETWKSELREFSTNGYDVGYRFRLMGQAGRVNAGSSFHIYQYDYYAELGERTEVRTNYLSAKVPVGFGTSINARYEAETGDETYKTARLGVRYDF